jgi:hypothetical protein
LQRAATSDSSEATTPNVVLVSLLANFIMNVLKKGKKTLTENLKRLMLVYKSKHKLMMSEYL